MKKLFQNLFYVFVATALVTIAPYLITFEKGQGIERGLFEYGIFAILLIYVSLKGRFLARNRKLFIIAIYFLLIIISYLDLQTILIVKKWQVGFYGFIPFVSCILALVLLKDVIGVSIKQANVVLFISFFVHFVVVRIYPEQPLFQFSLPLYLNQQNQSIDRSHLTEEFRTRYNVIDSVSITKHYVDTTRSNVVVLVESWGVPMDSAKFNEELALFEGFLKERGVHFRIFSRTRTAEREDLLDSVWCDSIGRCDSLFMPIRFARAGFKTSFFFGDDSLKQRRYKYIRNMGFETVNWSDSAVGDKEIAMRIDSLLHEAQVNQFIAWTTRDTRFPISDDALETEKFYYEKLFGTLRIVAGLARKYPNVRFIVQGDHEPILAPLEFQGRFYRRWVPFVVLN